MHLAVSVLSAKAYMRTQSHVYTKHLQHTRHVSDGDRRPLHFLRLGVNADLVLAAGSEVIEALSGRTASQAHFLLLAICKETTKQKNDLE